MHPGTIVVCLRRLPMIRASLVSVVLSRAPYTHRSSINRLQHGPVPLISSSSMHFHDRNGAPARISCDLRGETGYIRLAGESEDIFEIVSSRSYLKKFEKKIWTVLRRLNYAFLRRFKSKKRKKEKECWTYR